MRPEGLRETTVRTARNSQYKLGHPAIARRIATASAWQRSERLRRRPRVPRPQRHVRTPGGDTHRPANRGPTADK